MAAVASAGRREDRVAASRQAMADRAVADPERTVQIADRIARLKCNVRAERRRVDVIICRDKPPPPKPKARGKPTRPAWSMVAPTDEQRAH